jgi:hypothetical protein
MPETIDSRDRWIAACCAVVIAALYVVGIASTTELRHFVQTLPLWLGALGGWYGFRTARWLAMPLFLFWLAIVVLIWLYLLGWSQIARGHFSATEIAMTVAIGVASVFGIASCLYGGRRAGPALATGAFLFSAALQLIVFRISLLRNIARR